MYLSWHQSTITDFADETINSSYNQGYVFTRLGKGAMDQTRSLRIDLSKFEPSSENRRILRKTENLTLESHPIPYVYYHWSIHKLGKDFYEQKFGPNVFSAQKIKELITNGDESSFNRLLVYSLSNSPGAENIGYCIALETDQLLHYCYPFYLLTSATSYKLQATSSQLPNLGLGMMLKAIIWAKENGKKYIYLGSAQRPTDTYKLQFEGLEWFDGSEWQTDLEQLKVIIMKN